MCSSQLVQSGLIVIDPITAAAMAFNSGAHLQNLIDSTGVEWGWFYGRIMTLHDGFSAGTSHDLVSILKMICAFCYLDFCSFLQDKLLLTLHTVPGFGK